jgi:hypothetical protein
VREVYIPAITITDQGDRVADPTDQESRMLEQAGMAPRI